MPARIFSFLFFLFFLSTILYVKTVVAQDSEQGNINVNAIVPADPEDFQIDLSISPEGSPYAQNTVLTYEITYGSYLSGATGEFILETSWGLGQLPSGSVPVLEYVVGSATDGYADTAPVINPVTRTITWTIPNLPTNTTDQTVSFKLRTTDTYTGTSRVQFTTQAHLEAVGTETPPLLLTRQYSFNGSSDSTKSPTQTPTPAQFVTPTPTPTSPSEINSIDIATISSDSVEIEAGLSNPGTVTINYGTAPGNLTNSISSLTPANFHTVGISDLTENTQYYFRVRVNINGQIRESDLYTFRTGRDIPGPVINNSSVILLSDQIIIHNAGDSQDKDMLIPIPQNKPYHITFTISDRELLENIVVEVKNRNVLGINNFETTQRPVFTTDVLEVKPGTFSTTLITPAQNSLYDVVARVFDTNGNIQEIPLVTLQVVNPLMIIDSSSKGGIENARVLLSLWNARSQSFERIPDDYYPLKNPSYSEPNGEIDIVLPIAKYKAEVTAIGYESQEVEFTVFGGEESPYPTIELEKKPFSIIDAFRFYTTLTHDLISRSVHYSKDLGESQRFFRLTAYGVVSLFIFLSFLSLSQKMSVPLHLLPRFIVSRIKALGHTEDHTKKEGVIIDSEDHTPLSDVHVALLDVGSGKVVAETSTNHGGKFVFKKLPENLHAVVVLTKNSYYPSRFPLPAFQEEAPYHFALTQSKKDHVVSELIASFQNIIELLFNALLVLSFLSSILLGIFFGFYQSIPFILLSLTNLLLWFFYSHTKRITEI